MEAELNALKQMQDLLLEDVLQAIDVIEADDTQWGRRSFCRAVFAYIEGTCYVMRQEALHRLMREKLKFEHIPLINALSETTTKVKENGELLSENTRTSLSTLLSFTLKVYAEALGVKSKLRKDEPGYQAFRDSIKIRDRITHPKILLAMEITDKEVALLDEATQWLHKNINQILEDAVALLTARAGEDTSAT